ncbi:glycoside hydrolase family 1 protein [Oceanivirga salmonicida]|uniref:glycoside hydrolase family 1 protein n=1 Tax=Oceanivirga salmonicida TaxID=1769291 RepID=UPI0008330321|nr:glycoside hydrolase family 1 protein [Oceanivirga salmonicida]
MSLKKEFLWSASTSAYQFEGAHDVDGKGLSIQDTKTIFYTNENFKDGSNHYYRFKEDVKLMSELGLKAYRFSISWSRIMPDGKNKINKKGIKFYSDLIDELIKYNIEPIVTLYHFDLPDELEKLGGWLNNETVLAFEKYSKLLFENFGDRVKYWLTINEQNMMILHSQSINGEKTDKYLYQKNHNMFLANARAINLCHKMLKKAKIGPAINISYVYPETCSPEDNFAAMYANVHRNWLYLDMYVYGEYNHMALKYIKDKKYVLKISNEDKKILKDAKPDYIGVNYYCTMTVKTDAKSNDENIEKLDIPLMEKGFYRTVINPNLDFTEFKWQVDSKGFEITLNEVYSRYKLPILITENGLGAVDILEKDFSVHDDYRIKYLREHVENIVKACEQGVEILGYSPWSAIDLISTHQGHEKRYGFIYVDFSGETGEKYSRYKKDSFFWYKELIENNGIKF